MLVFYVTTQEEQLQIPADLVEQLTRVDDGTDKGMILGCFDDSENIDFKLIYSDGTKKKNGKHASISESMLVTDSPKGFYKFYIQSNKWKKKRKERLKADDFRCARCGAEKNVQVHHLNYDHVGNEDVENDLITLCRKCHADIHGKVDCEGE